MLRSSFILKIARERARKRRMHERDNPDQEIISRKIQTPKDSSVRRRKRRSEALRRRKSERGKGKLVLFLFGT